MGQTGTIDYDNLAQQHGGVAASGAASTPVDGDGTGVDYDALAQQHGGTPAPYHSTSSIGPREGDAVTNWLEDLEGDLKHGSGNTWVGRVMQHLGAQGTESGVSPGVAATVGGPATGPVRATRGFYQLGAPGTPAELIAPQPKSNAETMRAFNDVVGGVGQTLAPVLGLENPEFLAGAAPFAAGSALTQKALEKMGAKPETAEFLTNLTGIGFGAYMGMRGQKVPDYETWRDNNFSPAEGQEGSYSSKTGTTYSESELQQIHGVLSRQAGNPLISRLFGGPKSQMADYATWRNQNYRWSDETGKWEGPDAKLHTDAELRGIYDAKSSAQPTVTNSAIQTVQDALDVAGKVKSVARNNPVTNTILGPDPEALPADAAFIKATKPRNSIQNINDHVNRGLPDARRALDELGIDPDNMSLQDAEKSVYQAKKDVWDEFTQNYLNQAKDVTLDTTPVAQRIQKVADGMSPIQQRRLASTVDEIESNAADYDGQQMTVGQIEDRIQELNNELRAQQATYKVKEMDLRRDPKYAHKFAELDGLRQMENQAFSELDSAQDNGQPGSGQPTAAELKQRYGSLKVLQDVLDRRINVVERQNPAGLYDTASRMAGLGDIAGGVVGRDPGRLVAGVVKLRAGQNAAKLNDPNFLIQQAFKKTEASAPTIWNPDYMPGPPKGLLGPGPVVTPPPEDTSGSVPFTPPPYSATTRAQRLGLMLPERTAIEAPASLEPIEPGPQGVFPAQRIVVPDARTGEPRVMFTTSPDTSGQPRVAAGADAVQSTAEALAALRAKSRLVQDPVTKRMVRVFDNPIDTGMGGGTMEGDAGQAQNGNGAAGAGATVQGSRGTNTPVATGGATKIPVPGEDRFYPAHYQVRELSDIQPSHSGVTFQPNSRYELTNDRDYSNAVNQGKVISASAPGRFDPAYHITDNPDATNGPIVIDSRGNALGGNGRTMILDRVYRYNSGGAADYKALLMQKAAQFGIDPKAIEGMKQPVLVREIDDAEFAPGNGKQTAVTDFNKKGTAELTPSERAVTDSRRVSQGTLDDIAGRLDQAGPGVKLADVLGEKSGLEVLDKLIDDGVVSPQERAAYATKDELTQAGKERIGKLLVGRYFRDAAQLDGTSATVRGKLERLVAPLSRTEGVQGWDLSPAVHQAMDLLEDVRTHNAATIDDLLAQQQMFGGERYSPEAVTLAKHLQTTPANQLVQAVRAYTRDAGDAQRPLLTGGTVTPGQAFQEAFGKMPGQPAPPPSPALPEWQIVESLKASIKADTQAMQDAMGRGDTAAARTYQQRVRQGQQLLQEKANPTTDQR